MTGKQWESLRDIKEFWQNNVFKQCIRQSGLTLSCARCESIYLRVIIRIDGTGRLAEYTKIREYVCGNPATEKLESCFMAYLKTLQFPRNLRNMSIEMYLGNGLKC